MPNCAVIIFGHAVIQRNYEHMQNKRTNEILITIDKCCSQCLSRAHEKLSCAQEKLSRAQEKLSGAHEKLSRAQEKLSRAHEKHF